MNHIIAEYKKVIEPTKARKKSGKMEHILRYRDDGMCEELRTYDDGEPIFDEREEKYEPEMHDILVKQGFRRVGQ